MKSTLDQNAVTSRGGECGHNADRCRDDESARTRDHEKDQGAIEPVAPGAAQDQRRDDEDEEGQRHDRGRVDLRKAFDPLLGGGALTLRLAHHADHVSKCGIDARLRALDIERAVAVDAARKHLVSDRFVDRHALACDGRLTDSTGSRNHFAPLASCFKTALSPQSPVRIRRALRTELTKIFPSPR